MYEIKGAADKSLYVKLKYVLCAWYICNLMHHFCIIINIVVHGCILNLSLYAIILQQAFTEYLVLVYYLVNYICHTKLSHTACLSTCNG